VWKSKAVFTTSNKRKVLLRGAVCSVISCDDIDNAGPKHPFKTLRVFLMLHIRARPCFWFFPIQLKKFKVGSHKSVTPLWVQRKPATDGDNIEHLLAAYYHIQLFSTILKSSLLISAFLWPPTTKLRIALKKWKTHPHIKKATHPGCTTKTKPIQQNTAFLKSPISIKEVSPKARKAETSSDKIGNGL
jgi:hypothetical protein